MRRNLSSIQTIIMKIFFPGLWTVIFSAAILSVFFGRVHGPESLPRWGYVLFWIGGLVFVWWGSVRLKVVSVDNDFLYVSNYLKEIAIPLSDIYDVTENVWLNTHPVTIHLKSPSEFGDKILFMPKTRFSMFSSHPVVKELKQLAGLKLRGRNDYL